MTAAALIAVVALAAVMAGMAIRMVGMAKESSHAKLRLGNEKRFRETAEQEFHRVRAELVKVRVTDAAQMQILRNENARLTKLLRDAAVPGSVKDRIENISRREG